MKTKKHILVALSLGIVLFVACLKTDDVLSIQPQEEGVMIFKALHPAATRVSETQFEFGDCIGVFVVEQGDGSVVPLQVSGNWANNVAAAFDGVNWTTDKRIFWPDNSVDVYAYYPYMNLSSIDENPFSVALDQNAGNGYENSDFLWAKTSGATQADKAVSLNFAHRCSKLVVELVKGASFDGDFPKVSDMYVHNTVPTATVDFTTGTVTKYLFGERETIKMKRIDDGHFEAIIVPQRVDTRLPLIEFVSDGVSYLIEDSFNFKAGQQHTIRLTISSNPDQVKIDIGGLISAGWN